jgi:hypothetical protein
MLSAVEKLNKESEGPQIDVRLPPATGPGAPLLLNVRGHLAVRVMHDRNDNRHNLDDLFDNADSLLDVIDDLVNFSIPLTSAFIGLAHPGAWSSGPIWPLLTLGQAIALRWSGDDAHHGMSERQPEAKEGCVGKQRLNSP